jgi:transposase-like protein
MEESIQSEIVHVQCPHCNAFIDLSLSTLTKDNNPTCPNCGKTIHVDLNAAQKDASQQAHELDQSIDSLGSVE